MNDMLDNVWFGIEAAIQNIAGFMDALLLTLQFLGPEMIIFFLVLLCITLTRFFKKHFNTRRYVLLKENFDHWFELRQEAMNHKESKKGRAIAKNIDQAELNRAYYDLFFEGLLKSLITTWLPLLCTLAYVNRTFTPGGLMQWFGRPGLFMLNGHPILPWDIPSIFWFFISLLLVYALFPAMAWLQKTIKKETLRPMSP
ncbi:MAG: hypothetical protein QM498_13735 [Desulfobacterium sp.]